MRCNPSTKWNSLRLTLPRWFDFSIFRTNLNEFCNDKCFYFLNVMLVRSNSTISSKKLPFFQTRVSSQKMLEKQHTYASTDTRKYETTCTAILLSFPHLQFIARLIFIRRNKSSSAMIARRLLLLYPRKFHQR